MAYKRMTPEEKIKALDDELNLPSWTKKKEAVREQVTIKNASRSLNRKRDETTKNTKGGRKARDAP